MAGWSANETAVEPPDTTGLLEKIVAGGAAKMGEAGIAVVGGFVTSAFLLLIVLPSLLAGFGGRLD